MSEAPNQSRPVGLSAGSQAAGSRDLWALAFLAFALLPFNGAILLGRIPHDADNTLFGVPFFSLFALKPFALWNPFQFCGMPLPGNLQYQMFYPPRLLFRLFESTQVYGAYCLAHWLTAAWGSYVLGRVLRFRRGAAMLGALTFACGSFIQGRVSNPILFFSSAWFPGLLAAWLWALRRGDLHATAVAAVVFTVMASAGSPHSIFFGGVMLGVAWLWRVLARVRAGDLLGDERLKPLSAIRVAFVFGALFLAISAPLWWHALELLPHTVRSRASFADVTADPLQPSEIARLWFGGMGSPEYLDKTSYGGMLVIILVWAAIVRWGRRCNPGGFFRGPGGLGLVFGVLGILTALGARGGIYHLVYAVPGFRFLIGPTRALILFNMGWMLVAMHLAHEFLQWISEHGISRDRNACSAGPDLAAGAVMVSLLSLWVWLDAGSFGVLVRPRFANVLLFPLLFGAFWLAIGGAVVGHIVLARVRADVVVLLLLLVHVANLLHFNQRLVTRWEKPDYFREPETVRFLRAQAHDQPWRSLSWEPACLHPMDALDTRGPAHLTPKLPDYFRLREVQGYDPMMLREFVEFMTACAGRNPVDDPWRTAHVNDPASFHTDLAGARYVIGCPWEVVLSRDPDTRQVDITETRSMVALGITSLCDSRAVLPDGEVVGSIRLTLVDGQTSTLPVRVGQETAHVQATDPAARVGHRPIETNLRWPQYDPRQQKEAWWANYYCRIALPVAAPVRRVEWSSLRLDSVFLIQTMIAEFEPPPAERDRFTEAFRSGSIAIYRNRRALPLAYVVHRTLEASDIRGCVAMLRENRRDVGRVAVLAPGTGIDPGREVEGESVEFISWDCNSVRLKARTSSPGLLVLSESWYSGWRVWVGGEERKVLRVNGIYQGVALCSGGVHEVEFVFRPPSLAISLAVSLLGFAAAGWLVLWRARRRRTIASA